MGAGNRQTEQGWMSAPQPTAGNRKSNFCDDGSLEIEADCAKDHRLWIKARGCYPPVAEDKNQLRGSSTQVRRGGAAGVIAVQWSFVSRTAQHPRFLKGAFHE